MTEVIKRKQRCILSIDIAPLSLSLPDFDRVYQTGYWSFVYVEEIGLGCCFGLLGVITDVGSGLWAQPKSLVQRLSTGKFCTFGPSM